MRAYLITGANKGIGRATVQAILGHADDTFVWLGARHRGRGDAARAQLVAAQPGWADRVRVLSIDVGDDDSVRAAAAEVEALDGFVNNAGIGLGDGALGTVLNVNTWGPKRVCDHFLPKLRDPGGRIVNVSSASGPNFVARCSAERQVQLTHAGVTWADVEGVMREALGIESEGGDFGAAGLGDGGAYGLSKACLNAYTIDLARTHPSLVINACTPGFIETDLTRPFAVARGVSPEAMGMKSPAAGTRSILHLLLGDVGASGWYFGSDAERSPLDRYRSPGDPPYQGD